MHALVIKRPIFSCRTPEVSCLLTPKLCQNVCLGAHNLLRDAAERMPRGGSQVSESSGFTFALLYASVGLLPREPCIIQGLLPDVAQGQCHNTASMIPSFPAMPAPILTPTGVRQGMDKA